MVSNVPTRRRLSGLVALAGALSVIGALPATGQAGSVCASKYRYQGVYSYKLSAKGLTCSEAKRILKTREIRWQQITTGLGERDWRLVSSTGWSCTEDRITPPGKVVCNRDAQQIRWNLSKGLKR